MPAGPDGQPLVLPHDLVRDRPRLLDALNRQPSDGQIGQAVVIDVRVAVLRRHPAVERVEEEERGDVARDPGADEVVVVVRVVTDQEDVAQGGAPRAAERIAAWMARASTNPALRES